MKRLQILAVSLGIFVAAAVAVRALAAENPTAPCRTGWRRPWRTSRPRPRISPLAAVRDRHTQAHGSSTKEDRRAGKRHQDQA